MSEDLSRINDINIKYQFWVFNRRFEIKNININNRILKAIIKRIVTLENKKNLDPKAIPIVLNNFNRISFLKQQVDYLHSNGHWNLYVIDNNSTYKPLLEYYKSNKIKIFALDVNVGFLSIWRTLIYEYFKDSYYVYSDSDILPTDDCPDDFMKYFLHLLEKYPDVDKVGFGLKIDDIPDHYLLKDKVIQHEKQFWNKPVEKNVYEAMIDTTFALYRPKRKGGYWLKALRTGGDYVAHHLPWYSDSNNLSEEDKYYNKSIKTSTHWTEMLNCIK